MESPHPLPPRSPRHRWYPWLAVLAFSLYAVLLGCHAGACAGMADSSGYLNEAHLLASGKIHTPVRSIPDLPLAGFTDYLYNPLGFKPAHDGNGLVPVYPVGMPLMIVVAARLIGWDHAAEGVVVFHSLAGLILIFGLGQMFGPSRRASLLGSLLLAASPLYLSYSLQAMSDVPALVWCTATALAAWRTRRNDRWAAATGAALSIAVLIRPTNLLMLLPIMVAWWAGSRSEGAVGRSALRAGLLTLAGLPGAVLFCLVNRAAYGHPFTTGYGDTGYLFSTSVIGETLLHYAWWLPVLFTPLMGFSLLLPWTARREPRTTLFLATWILAYAGFYLAYTCTHETWWYLRFLLPGIPALIVGALWAAERLAAEAEWIRRISSGTRWAIFIALCVGTIAADLRWTRSLRALKSGDYELVYPTAAHWLAANLPPDAIVAAMQTSGSLFYYTRFTLVRWDQLLRPGDFEKVRAAAGRRPIYAALFDYETKEAFEVRMPGHWEIVAHLSPVTVWHCSAQ